MVKTSIDLKNKTVKDYNELIKKLNTVISAINADHALRKMQHEIGYRLTYYDKDETTEKCMSEKMADIIIEFIYNDSESKSDENEDEYI